MIFFSKIIQSSLVLAPLGLMLSVGAQPPVEDLAVILDHAPNEATVRFVATVERAIDEDLYLVRAGNATVRVDTWRDDLGAIHLPIGSKIDLTGEMDRHLYQHPEIYLRSFAVVAGADTATTSTLSTVQDIPSEWAIAEIRKSGRDGQLVTVEGRIIRRIGDDSYLIEDSTGSIRIDAWVEGRGHVALPVGETVRLKGTLDRDFMQPLEIYLLEVLN